MCLLMGKILYFSCTIYSLGLHFKNCPLMFHCQQPLVSMSTHQNLKLKVIKSETHKTPDSINIWKLGNSLSLPLVLPKPNLKKFPFSYLVWYTKVGSQSVYWCLDQAMDTHLPKAVFIWFWPNPNVSLFTSWPPKPNRHLPKTFNEAKVEVIFIFLHQMLNFFKVFGNQSGASSCCGLINHRWVFHLKIRLAIEKILGSKVLYFGVCCILINFCMNDDEVKLFLVKVKKKGFSSNSSEKKEAYSADSKVTSKLSLRWKTVIRPKEFLLADFPILKVNCLSALPSWLCLIVYLVIIRFSISTN